MATKTIVIHISRRKSEIAESKKQSTTQSSKTKCLAGTELKKLYSALGFKTKKNCNCNKHAATMDQNGCDWCEKHIDRITGWIKYECKKRGIPFVKIAVVGTIRLAISRARKAEQNSK